MKRTPLRRRTPLRGRRRPIPDEVREQVWRRSKGRCEIDHPGCGRRATDQHHRLPRSAGGPHTVDNLLALCAVMHRYVHEHPEESYAAGWLVRRGDDPAAVPWTRDNQAGR